MAQVASTTFGSPTLHGPLPAPTHRETSAVDAATGESLSTEAPHRKVVGRIGAWQLVRLLHESDLARVYLARPAESDSDQRSPYVLKVLRNRWWRDPLAIEMQRRAAWAGQRATHANLLPVLASGVKQPPFFIVFPRLDGESLSSVLARQRRLPLSVALWIARQTAEALDALHQQAKMVHGDVKPANLMVAEDGHTTLIDLGFVHPPGQDSHWSNRPVCGTLNYIAPETVASTMAEDARSDLYSLGVVLYEMITGSLPLRSESAEQLIRMHREMRPACIRERCPETPKAVASLVHRLLAKDPLRRPNSAAEVARLLVRLEIAAL